MSKIKTGFATFIICAMLELVFGAYRHNVMAQISNPGVQQSGTVVAGHCAKWGPGLGQISDAGTCAALSPVQSVFGRVGAVVAAVGDYSFNQLSGFLAASQLPGFSGDVTASAGSNALTLNTVNTSPGSFGGANAIPTFTVNGKGLMTVSGAVTPSIPFSEVTGNLACGQMPALTGDTTSSAGSCANVNIKVNGVSFSASPSTDTTPIITASNVATYTAIPNCSSGVLQYSTSTHLFSCGAAGTGTVTSVVCSGITITSTGTCLTTGQLPGTATNDNASSGNVGQYVESVVPFGSAVSLTSGSVMNVTSISLSAGDWDVTGLVITLPGSGTTQSGGFAFLNTSVAAPTPPNAGGYNALTYTSSANSLYSIPLGPMRMSLASTTTVYLLTQVNFAVSTLNAYGIIRARRIR